MENNTRELNEAIETLAKQIAKSLQYSITNYDRTFISVISNVNNNGTYDIIDEFGIVRNVVLGIPNITLSIGQRVYITIPSGNLKNMYISGIHPQINKR